MIERLSFLRVLVACLWILPACAGSSASPTPSTVPTGVPKANPSGAPKVVVPSSADVLTSSSLPVTVDQPLEGDPMAVTVHRLSNGLTVYIGPMPSETSVRAWTVVRAGSRNDPAEATGLAHYLEHMLFKGTSQIGARDFEKERIHLARIAELYRQLRTAGDKERSALLDEIDAENQKAAQYANTGELKQLFGRLGVSRFDAFTYFDITAYTHEVPANLIGVWARIEAERYQNPAFRAFHSELESVYEERNLRDTPDLHVWNAMLAGLFPDHPYGTQTVIGSVDHLKNPGFNEMVKFHQTWYVPNNMAILLVGAVDPVKTVAELESAFASWHPRELPASLPGRIEPLHGRVQKDVLDKGAQSVTLAWQLPRGKHDPATWDIISELLGSPRGGLLQRELVLTRKIPWLSVRYEENEDCSYLMVQANLGDHQTHVEAERLIIDVLDRLAAGDFTDELLRNVILNKRVADARDFESSDERIGWLGYAFTQSHGWPDLVDRLKRRASITKAEVVREASAHLGKALVAVYRKDGTYVPPKVDKPKITPIQMTQGELGPFAQSILKLPVDPVAPHWLEEGRDYKRTKTRSGLLVTSHNDTSDLFEITYTFDGGLLNDPLLCYALDHLNLVGVGDLQAVGVQDKLYGLAATVSAGCYADIAYVKIGGLEANLEPTLSFVRQWFAKPRIDAVELKRVIANQLRLRRESLDEKTIRQDAAYRYLLWGRNSSYETSLSNLQLLAIKPSALVAKLRSLTNTGHTTLFFGKRDITEDTSLVAIGDGKRHGKPASAQRLIRSEKPAILFVPFPSADARLYLSIPRGPASAQDQALAALFSRYAGRYTWDQIREARGLAYSVGTWYSLNERAQDDSGMISSVATQADSYRRRSASYSHCWQSFNRQRIASRPQSRPLRASIVHGERLRGRCRGRSTAGACSGSMGTRARASGRSFGLPPWTS